MQIDPKSSIPIFRQIADQLRNRIEAGVYRSGEILPSLRALAIDIKVNPNTIQRAYDALDREGIVETRRGVGVFVASYDRKLRSEAEQKLLDRFAKAIRVAGKSGVPLDAMRKVFEEAMRAKVAEIRK